MPAISYHFRQTEFPQWLSVAGKGPKDNDDPIGQRGFAKRIAEMKWWVEDEAPETEAPLAEEHRQPRTGDAEQPPESDEGAAERD